MGTFTRKAPTTAGIRFLDILAFILVIYNLVVWWFAFLPAVGETENSGSTDPTVIKWLVLTSAVLAVLFGIIALFWGFWRGMQANDYLITRTTWHTLYFLLMNTFILVVLTVWAFLWDDRFSALFGDGSPVIPASADPSFEIKMRAYIEWKVILILIVTSILVLIYFAIDAWKDIVMGVNAVGRLTSNVASRSSSRNVQQKRQKRENFDVQL